MRLSLATPERSPPSFLEKSYGNEMQVKARGGALCFHPASKRISLWDDSDVFCRKSHPRRRVERHDADDADLARSQTLRTDHLPLLVHISRHRLPRRF